ncbi:lectin subunit alpha-like [Musca vetustissima]|uniref:lectin subunit alpha-like n=1 Tax=Musca vetustissima TaxID=27455 RepID=UPI002AB68F5C|nr:lectin subunit alpha-like [Musca vetustissima]
MKARGIKNFLFCGFLLAVLITKIQAIPQDKYHQMDNFGRIFIDTEQKYNWYQAWNECALRNLTLITLDTAAKSAALTSLLRTKKLKFNFYLGGHDLAEEGQFVWPLTGKRFDFANWNLGNPDNYKDMEHCVHIWENTDYEWNDTRCVNKMGFICEENPYLALSRRDLELKKDLINQLLSL